MVLTTLHSFGVFTNGAYPAAGLVQGSDGNFYGTTTYGSSNNAGTVFRISATGALTTLYSFTGGKDGAYPSGGLVQGSDGDLYGTTAGNLYGTTANGGNLDDFGTAFKISATGALTTLYSFTGGTDGRYPNGLVQGSDGDFYGTTAGNLYGTTANGGNLDDSGGKGTVFRISATGALTTLHSFTGRIDGKFPGGLVQAGDGNFYGTTAYGGTNDTAATVISMARLSAAAPTTAMARSSGSAPLGS